MCVVCTGYIFDSEDGLWSLRGKKTLCLGRRRIRREIEWKGKRYGSSWIDAVRWLRSLNHGEWKKLRFIAHPISIGNKQLMLTLKARRLLRSNAFVDCRLLSRSAKNVETTRGIFFSNNKIIQFYKLSLTKISRNEWHSLFVNKIHTNCSTARMHPSKTARHSCCTSHEMRGEDASKLEDERERERENVMKIAVVSLDHNRLTRTCVCVSVWCAPGEQFYAKLQICDNSAICTYR